MRRVQKSKRHLVVSRLREQKQTARKLVKTAFHTLDKSSLFSYVSSLFILCFGMCALVAVVVAVSMSVSVVVFMFVSVFVSVSVCVSVFVSVFVFVSVSASVTGLYLCMCQ